MKHYIKCPQCSEEGYQYLEDKRRRFRCNACGLDTYLKLLNIKTYDKNRDEKTSSARH